MMKTKQEIIERVRELKIELEPVEDSYFLAVEAKQNKEEISQTDFLKIESEYETMRQLECEICSEPGEMKSAYYQNLWICWGCEAEAYADAKKTSSKRLALINKQRG